MTVAVSLDRYIVICHPLSQYALDYNEIVSPLYPTPRHLLDKRRVGKCAIGVTVFALLICIPSFLEYETKSSKENCTHLHNYTYKTNVPTRLRTNPGYAYYKMIVVDGIIRFLIPVLVLIYTNIR